jgi:hypothetical protein
VRENGAWEQSECEKAVRGLRFAGSEERGSRTCSARGGGHDWLGGEWIASPTQVAAVTFYLS